MVKIPSTVPGVQAVEILIAEGINVNITLMFSLAHYEAVAQAYLRGLKRNAKPHQVSSVASFFVSRVDTEVDRALETIGTPEALSLRGKIAIANARVVYRRFREIFLGTPFEEFRRRGARLQRPLWASTGTKNPAFSDVLYVEELIGPHTINTIPPATLNAFRDHGRVQPTIEAKEQDAGQALSRLAKLGIDLGAITEKLLADGITAFTHSLDELLASLKEKRSALLESQAAQKSASRATRVA
jgi:transaldolase